MDPRHPWDPWPGVWTPRTVDPRHPWGPWSRVWTPRTPSQGWRCAKQRSGSSPRFACPSQSRFCVLKFLRPFRASYATLATGEATSHSLSCSGLVLSLPPSGPRPLSVSPLALVPGVYESPGESLSLLMSTLPPHRTRALVRSLLLLPTLHFSGGAPQRGNQSLHGDPSPLRLRDPTQDPVAGLRSDTRRARHTHDHPLSTRVHDGCTGTTGLLDGDEAGRTCTWY